MLLTKNCLLLVRKAKHWACSQNIYSIAVSSAALRTLSTPFMEVLETKLIVTTIKITQTHLISTGLFTQRQRLLTFMSGSSSYTLKYSYVFKFIWVSTVLDLGLPIFEFCRAAPGSNNKPSRTRYVCSWLWT